MNAHVKSLLIKKRKEHTRYKLTETFNPIYPNMSTQLENDIPLSVDPLHLQQQFSHCYRNVLEQFRRISRSFVNFNLLFALLFSTELFLLLLFLPFLSHSAIFAFALGGLFLTCFSYFVLLFYYQARKPEQLHELKEQFLQSCRQLLPAPSGTAQHHLSLSEALVKLSQYLQDFESNFYNASFSFLSPLMTRFSSLCHWKDVFQMKQWLLQAAVEEHLKQIRATPIDLEVHTSLAHVYIALSKLYRTLPQTASKWEIDMKEKCRVASQRAIEEFKILSHYAPNDPWVHEQLASGYCDLGLIEDEMREIELLLKLRPQDKEILFRLGTLYFQQGLNAKGLQIYEELKAANFKKAEMLIASYGSTR